MRPTLRQLEYLVALADKLNFRRAAEACFVTQPALSAQIRQLERQLGLTLFERDRRRVIPTEAGRELVEGARRVLALLDDWTESTRAFLSPLSGKLRVGVIPTVAPYLLPRVLPAVHRAHPELRLYLREEKTSSLVEMLAGGRLDLLLLALESDLGELETLPLFSDPFRLLVPADHRLAGRASVRESDLAAERILLLEDGHCLRDQALSICRLGGASEHGEFRASSLNTLVRMVASGLGVTLAPALAIDAEVSGADGLAVVPLVKRAPARTIGLAWRRSSPRAEEFRLLADELDGRLPAGVVALPRRRTGTHRAGRD